MNTCVRTNPGLLRVCVVQPQPRFMANRPRIKKPDRANWFRQRLLAVSSPKWEWEHKTTEDLWRDCAYSEKADRQQWLDETNELEKIFAKHMVEYFEKSKMVAFFHSNSIAKCNFRKAWQDGRRIGMELKRYSLRVGKHGLRGTQWENCLHFFMDHEAEHLRQAIMFSPEVNPKQLLKFERKIPEFHLLGAVVENRIVSRDQLVQMVDMPSLDQLRGELVSVLQSPASRTTQLLGSNQQQLTANLQQYTKDQQTRES